jgi:hypothetical protein
MLLSAKHLFFDPSLLMYPCNVIISALSSAFQSLEMKQNESTRLTFPFSRIVFIFYLCASLDAASHSTIESTSWRRTSSNAAAQVISSSK